MKRGESGKPLPVVYQSLHNETIDFYRSQLTLVIGQGGSGKSILTQNLIAHMGVPTLAVLLDQDQLTAASRFVATLTGDMFLSVKTQIDEYQDTLRGKLSHVDTLFRAEGLDDIERALNGYMQRYGEAPQVLLIDNLTNLASGYEDEWSILRGLTLRLDELARELEMAVICCSHTSDWDRYDPPPRKLLMGKVAQFPRLIVSVGFNPLTGAYKVAAVKNSSGKSDLNAQQPLDFYCNPATMQLQEQAPHPQVVAVTPVATVANAAAEIKATFGGLRV